MTAKRIRCECGRVYQPAKSPTCPSCGASADPKANEAAPSLRQDETTEENKPLAITGGAVAIIGGLVGLALIVFLALVRHSPSSSASLKEQAVPQPTLTATPTPPPTASAVASITPPLGFVPPQAFDLATAIASAAPGATVKVPPGFYSGGLEVAKALRLVGTSGQTIIQSDGRECLKVRSPGVAVQGVQFICNGIGDLPAISVAEGAALELDSCRVQTSTGVGISINGNSALNAIGTNVSVGNGTALRLQGGKATLTQTTVSDSKLGINLSGGGTLELKSCAFERNGTGDDKGGIVWGAGEGTNVTASDCQFAGNSGGLSISANASLAISGSSFKENGANAKVAYGVIAIGGGARATVTGSNFESNKQGVAVTERGTLEMDHCTFSGNGGQSRQLVLEAMPISITGEGAMAKIRNTSISNSVQFGVAMLNHASAVLENVEIAGTKAIALAVGDTSSPPCRIEIRKSHILHNQTGLGLYAGSSAKVEETEFRENAEGIMVGEPKTRLELHKSYVNLNSERGLAVFNEAQAVAIESQFVGNARGAQSGLQRKSGGRASVTLEDCDVGENRVFGVGCFANNDLTLRRVSFDDGNKQAIYKERNASVTVESDAEPEPSASATPEEDASPEASASAPPQKRSNQRTRPHRTRRPEDEAARILRHLFGPH